jgi:hypothetical protein
MEKTMNKMCCALLVNAQGADKNRTALFRLEGGGMRSSQDMLRRVVKLGLILMIGVGMNANAGLFGFGGDSWKEEVLLHDGSKIIVKRSQSYGGRHEIGQSPPVKEQEVTFTLPAVGERVTWKSEYGEDVGRANFNLLALHILNNTPYIVASPNLCLSYNKWGRPNPPYVIFKYEDKEWHRIPLQELPVEFKNINLVINTEEHGKKFNSLGKISADEIKKVNGSLTQPEYHSILREPLPVAQINQMCEERVLYKGSWILPNDSIARKMIDQRTK